MSDLEDAIAAARRDISREESPVRRALRDAYRDAVNELQVNLDLVTRQIRDARAAGVEVNPDWLRRQTRYRTLMAQAEGEFRRFSRDGFRIVEGGKLRAVSGGAQHAWEMAEAVGADVGFLANINKPAVERTAAAMQRGPLRDILDGYGDNAAQVIEDALMQGVIQGTSPREVSRQVNRELKSGGIMARMDTLIRSEMMRSFRGSLFDSFSEMGIERWRWTAALSERTCLACLARSGSVYLMTQPFMAAHPNCRCVPSPYVEGVDIESGVDWFARQDADTQRAMMPSNDAHNAYQQGDIKLVDFIGHRRSKVWGTAIRERSGREVLEGAR